MKRSRTRCKQCLSCLEACASGAVTATGHGVEFDREKCRVCAGKQCVGSCPSGALSIIGVEMEAAQVIERVGADIRFYRNSGGGVTFSGGEPFSQPEFLGEMLSLAKGLGIHTAVETCGFSPADIFMPLAPLVDLFLFDLKIADGEEHERVAGRPNHTVVENLRWLASLAPGKVLVRLPYIPGYTSSRPNIEAIAGILCEWGLNRVQIEPYHALGIDKYADTGKSTETVAAIQTPGTKELREAAEIFAGRGIAVEI